MYEVGDKMTFEFPEMRLNKTDKVCLHAMSSIIHFARAFLLFCIVSFSNLHLNNLLKQRRK